MRESTRCNGIHKKRETKTERQREETRKKLRSKEKKVEKCSKMQIESEKDWK